jgi:hypothetical protein
VKLTLEHGPYRLTVEVVGEVTALDVVRTMRGAMVGIGYEPETVDEAICEYADELSDAQRARMEQEE